MENILFKSFKGKNIELSNRIIMAPMTRSRSDNPENKATELTAKYYEQRATAGLIISEGTYISEEAIGYINVPAIYTPTQIESWKLVTNIVHEKGGIIFAQLWHTGRLSHPDLHNGELPLAPSALNPNTKIFTQNGFTDTVTPREITVAQIKKTIADFTQGAINAIEAGFDGIELHAANGYLFHQFFNLYSNNRQDEYGGSIENRARFLFELLDDLKEKFDIKKVAVRLNPSLHGIQGMMLDEESIPVHDYIINKLNEYDLAYLHLTEPLSDVSENPLALQKVAKHYRPMYNGTLIINGGFNKEKAEKVLNDGDADLVAFGVPFIANPDLVERYKIDAPLNVADKNTFYTAGEKGFTDYPFLHN
jgi:N-ethylmaleimide reductase